MRKSGKFFGILFSIILLLSGCKSNTAAPKPAPPLRIVTQVDVTCVQSDSTWHRRYTHPQKMQALLNYLRLLTYCSQAGPDIPPADHVYWITVTHLDGTVQQYEQRADLFLFRNGSTWEQLDPEQAAALPQLLEAMPSD